MCTPLWQPTKTLNFAKPAKTDAVDIQKFVWTLYLLAVCKSQWPETLAIAKIFVRLAFMTVTITSKIQLQNEF